MAEKQVCLHNIHVTEIITHPEEATNSRKKIKMASFSVEEFIGNGILKELLQKLLEEGWDDVPTLKLMSSEDMDSLQMTQKQKVGHQYIITFVQAYSHLIIQS